MVRGIAMSKPTHAPRRARRLRVGLLMLLAAALILSPLAAAAAGDLDTTFDGDGKVVTDFAGGSDDSAGGVAVQSDGKTVVAGGTRQGTVSAFGLVRYGVNGALDPTFDGDGKVRTDFTPSSLELAVDVLIQGDGKIVAAGRGVGTSFDFALARYNPDGTLDPSFGTGGKVLTDFVGGRDFPSAIALQPDGKIVFAGWSRPTGAGPFDFAVARYNPNGALDASFDGDGRVITDISAGSDDYLADVAIQADGKIVVGGSTGGFQSAALVRYLPDGSLDSSFDGDGKVVVSTPTLNVAGLAIQSDGKIVTAGYPLGVTRFNSNGSVDASFGSNGTATTPLQSAGATALVVQPDGKIIAGGTAGLAPGPPQDFDFAVARFRPDGSLDGSFGSAGTVKTNLGASGDTGSSIALAPNGKIVLAGRSGPLDGNGPNDFAVVRYLGAPPACIVPNVRNKKLAAAKTSIKRAHCVVGKVTRKSSKRVKKGRVISQSPRAGATLPTAGKVNLVVSKGRKR